MTNNDYISFALAQLSLCDYEVYISLSNRNYIALQFDKLQKCKIVKTAQAKDGLVANLTNINDCSFILAVDSITQQCWLIPISSLKSDKVVRITQKFELYKVSYSRVKKLEQTQNAKDLNSERVIQSTKEALLKRNIPSDASILDLLKRSNDESKS